MPSSCQSTIFWGLYDFHSPVLGDCGKPLSMLPQYECERYNGDWDMGIRVNAVRDVVSEGMGTWCIVEVRMVGYGETDAEVRTW